MLLWQCTGTADSLTSIGIRSVGQAEANCTVSDLPDMSKDLLAKLRGHAWRRAFWHGGK